MRVLLRKCLSGPGAALMSLSKRIYQSPQELSVAQWYEDQGETFRLDYDLDATSLVFDLGGFEGQWTSDVFSMYRCTVHVFEPVQEFAQKIERRFRRNPRIIVHRFGLSNEDRIATLALQGNGSSLFKADGRTCDIKLVRATDFFELIECNKIDLLKINIEGGEYDLLDHLIGTGFINNIANIQVQFHDFVPDAEQRMRAIQNELAKTHHLTYQYLFVWENWRRNGH